MITAAIKAHSSDCRNHRKTTKLLFCSSSSNSKMKANVLAVLFLLHVLQTEGQPLGVEDPVRVPTKVLREGANGTCPSEQNTINAKDELRRLTISTTLAAITAGCGGVVSRPDYTQEIVWWTAHAQLVPAQLWAVQSNYSFIMMS